MYVFIAIGDIRSNKIAKSGSRKREQGCLINIAHCNSLNKCTNNLKIAKSKRNACCDVYHFNLATASESINLIRVHYIQFIMIDRICYLLLDAQVRQFNLCFASNHAVYLVIKQTWLSLWYFVCFIANIIFVLIINLCIACAKIQCSHYLEGNHPKKKKEQSATYLINVGFFLSLSVKSYDKVQHCFVNEPNCEIMSPFKFETNDILNKLQNKTFYSFSRSSKSNQENMISYEIRATKTPIPSSLLCSVCLAHFSFLQIFLKIVFRYNRSASIGLIFLFSRNAKIVTIFKN